MKFVGIAKEDLEGLHRSMEIFENVYDSETFRPYLYVIVNQGGLLDLAADSIREDGDYQDEEQSPRPSSLAIAIPLSADVLYYMNGSGLMVGDAGEDFVFTSGEEDVRSGHFYHGGGRDKLSLNQVIAFAISEDITYMDEFLKSHGPAMKAEPKEEQGEAVERTEPVAEDNPDYKPNPPGVGGVQSKAKTSADVKGIDKILIAGKKISELKVTEIIEVSDFVMDHPKGTYLHAETPKGEWLMYSTSPKEGKAATERMLMFKEDLDEAPQVDELKASDVEALLEGLADEELEK